MVELTNQPTLFRGEPEMAGPCAMQPPGHAPSHLPVFFNKVLLDGPTLSLASLTAGPTEGGPDGRRAPRVIVRGMHVNWPFFTLMWRIGGRRHGNGVRMWGRPLAGAAAAHDVVKSLGVWAHFPCRKSGEKARCPVAHPGQDMLKSCSTKIFSSSLLQQLQITSVIQWGLSASKLCPRSEFLTVRSSNWWLGLYCRSMQGPAFCFRSRFN